MTMENLKQRLLSDLSAVGVNTEESFELVLKDYSKSYYGRYYPDKKRVVVYVHEDRDLNKLIVTPDEIAKVVSGWTKIPVEKLTEKESERLLNLEKILHKRVIFYD